MSQVLSWFRRDGDDWVLSLYLQPGAKKSGSAGLHDGCLKLRLAAPPVEGKANAALIAFLADWFGIPKNRVSIQSGELSRRKVVRIAGSARSPEGLLAV
ncbi:YggU family protein [Burkholderiaceae bacterium DAT-1]|nr:YggU family protein [Burkholderiaceae bacterium DAT-1]